MWIRKRLDIAWGDVLCALGYCFLPRNRKTLLGQVEACWPQDLEWLGCLSARSGFDLLLDCLQFPPGSEVLISSVTIPGVVRIIEKHKLVPIPIDLEIESMAPRLELIRSSVTSATRAMIVTSLFGGRVALEPILNVARQHKLFFVHDCAQAFAGCGASDCLEADVTIFSFGPIKTATALGGGMLAVRHPELLRKMRQRQDCYPVQSRVDYLKRVLKYAALKAASGRLPYGLFVRLCRSLGKDHDRFVNSLARGFPDSHFFDHIRRQPSVALLCLLQRQLKRFRADAVRTRAERGNTMCGFLDKGIQIPGAMMPDHTYWVFPVLAEEPRRLITALQREGFDATQGHSLCVVSPPVDRPDLDAVVARDVLSRMVFLPVYAGMRERDLKRMADVLVRECN